jgi:hypothetical protein
MSMSFRKEKRRMNKMIRLINKDIEKDNMWQGRFVIVPVDFQKVEFEDKSGVYLAYALEFIDKQTNEYAIYVADSSKIFLANTLWYDMNNFITEVAQAEVKNTGDWRNAKFKVASMKEFRNTPNAMLRR